MLFFFLKQKTTYEMRMSDWSSDVCSSDLITISALSRCLRSRLGQRLPWPAGLPMRPTRCPQAHPIGAHGRCSGVSKCAQPASSRRSEEHTSELQSLMRNSYAVFCLKKKKEIIKCVKKTHNDSIDIKKR